MHDQPTGSPSSEDEFRRFEGAVLTQILETYPGQVRQPELALEMRGKDDPAWSIRISDTVRELCGVGLLFRSGPVILPTRAALRAYEVLVLAA